MYRLLVAILLLISSEGLWAQSTDLSGAKTSNPQAIQAVDSKVENEKSKASSILEFSFPTSQTEIKIDPEFGSETTTKNSSPYSVGVGFGVNNENNRIYGLFSFEKLDLFTVNAVEKNRWNLGFKLAYDQCIKPWITDFYLSGALLYYPVQGERFVSNGTEFSSKGGLGFEASMGWISPFNIAFNFGYKSVYKDYSYDKYDTVMGRTDEKRTSMSYGWVFLAASIGRYKLQK